MASRQAWSRFATATQPLAHRAFAQPTASSSALRHLSRGRPATPTLSQTVSSAPSTPILFVRLAHNIPRPRAPNRRIDEEPDEEPQEEIQSEFRQLSTDPAAAQAHNDEISAHRGLAPHYELTFTCKPCGTRSSHNVTKQGYHQGSVLITCPECRNRHIISDHLGIFGSVTGSGSTKGRTIEDIMREKGQLVKKGTLGEDGDIEFWEDGTTTDRSTRLAMEDVLLPRKNEKPAADKGDAPGSTFQSAGKS
ncbi:hypothetical protein SEUCBS139899_007548 [Sporothrix eucalyptigena]|uniref:DNL-type domain-containing protein n=1 Tax=Sporothrix eucalyptigena TaxID=1812306 RepID=A0ABP0CCV6_9PEZI